MYICIYIYTHINIDTHIYVRMYAYIHIRYIGMYVRMYFRIHKYLYTYTYMYTYTYIFVCIYTFLHTKTPPPAYPSQPSAGSCFSAYMRDPILLDAYSVPLMLRNSQTVRVSSDRPRTSLYSQPTDVPNSLYLVTSAH